MDLEYYLAEQMVSDAIVIAYLKDMETAKDFYRALCNMRWSVIDYSSEDEKIVEKLKGTGSTICSYSWRTAGGIIADIRNQYYNTGENYMDFYCSGDEGQVSDIVRECFRRMGWEPLPWPERE